MGPVLVELVAKERPDFELLGNLAELLSQSDPGAFKEIKQVWQMLRRRYLAADLDEIFAGTGTALPITLLEEGTLSDRVAVLNSTAEKGSNFAMGEVEAEGEYERNVEGLVLVVRAWTAAVERLGGGTTVRLQDPEIYLRVAADITTDDQPTSLVRPNVTADALAVSFARRLTSLNGEDALKQARIVLSHDPGVKGVSSLLEAADAVLSDGEDVAQALAAVDILGKLRLSQSPAKERVVALFASGSLQQRAQWSFTRNPRLAARISALMILELQTLPRPGELSWEVYLEQNKEFAKDVDAALADYGEKNVLEKLAHQNSQDEEHSPLLSAIIKIRVKDKNLGIFNSLDVLSDGDPYWSMVHSEDEGEFYGLVLRAKDDWDKLAGQNLNLAAQRVFKPLINAPNNNAVRRKARSQLRRALGSLSSERWRVDLADRNAPLMVLAADLQSLEARALSLGASLFDALQGYLPTLTENGDEALLERWFRATMLLSVAGRKTILSNLRDRLILINEVHTLLGVLKAGGSTLLQDGSFRERADESVRHVLVPLIGHSEGLVWLLESNARTGDWVRLASHSTQGFLAERIAEKRKASDAAEQALIDRISAAWKLSS